MTLLVCNCRRPLGNTILPLASTPLHMLLLVCLFIYLFTFVIGACVALFVCLFPLQVVSVIDRQWADANYDHAHCIRRGLGRRLRSSLLLNLSPRCDPPCRVVYLIILCSGTHGHLAPLLHSLILMLCPTSSPVPLWQPVPGPYQAPQHQQWSRYCPQTVTDCCFCCSYFSATSICFLLDNFNHAPTSGP